MPREIGRVIHPSVGGGLRIAYCKPCAFTIVNRVLSAHPAYGQWCGGDGGGSKPPPYGGTGDAAGASPRPTGVTVFQNVGGIHECPADFDGAHPYDKSQHKKGLAPLFDLHYKSFSTTKYAILLAGTVALPSCTQP